MYIIIIFYNYFRLKSRMSNTEKRMNPQNLQSDSLSTNEVIQHIEQNGDIVFYLPCYVRFLLKQIKQVNAEQMEATITGTLIFSFYYGNISRQLIKEFVGNEKAILLQFNQEESILLKEDKDIVLKEDHEEKIITFIIRQSFKASIKGNVFLTPFETLDLYISVSAQTVHLQERNQKKINIKFNCMTSDRVQSLSHGEQLSFGYYRIANYYLQSKYSKSRKFPFQQISFFGGSNEARIDHKDGVLTESKISHDNYQIRNYQYAHFRIPVFKYPAVTILTIFIPIWIIGLINLFVFFQEVAFGQRLATIAVIALAYVAFLPTINTTIPQSPNVKLVDILILIQLAATILLLVESFNVRDRDNFIFNWRESNLFIASFALNSSTILAILALFIVHKFFWEVMYTRPRIDINKKYKNILRRIWKNDQCDKDFSHYASYHKLRNI